MDRDDIADNLVRKWKNDVRDALVVSTQLVSKVEELYKAAFVEEEDNQAQIDVLQALNSD